jgi:hypothetical protein
MTAIARRIVEALTVGAMATLSVGCAVSVQIGYGNSREEHDYLAAIAQPMNELTVAASLANQACAGGSRPDPTKCYSNTEAEIEAARRLEAAMRAVPTPSRFSRANEDLLHGLGDFIQGLAERNQALADRSTSEYVAGEKLIMQALATQRAAIAEYPPDVHITQ